MLWDCTIRGHKSNPERQSSMSSGICIQIHSRDEINEVGPGKKEGKSLSAVGCSQAYGGRATAMEITGKGLKMKVYEEEKVRPPESSWTSLPQLLTKFLGVFPSDTMLGSLPTCLM